MASPGTAGGWWWHRSSPRHSQQPNAGCQNYSRDRFTSSLAQNLGSHIHLQPLCGRPIGSRTHWHVDPLGEHQTVLPNSAWCFIWTHFQPVRTRGKNTVNIVASELKKKYIKKIKPAIFRGFQVEGCLSESKKRAAVVLTLRFSHPCQRFEAG